MLSLATKHEPQIGSDQPKVASALLRRIAYNDQMRADLVADPIGILARYGVELDPRHVPSEVRLPPKSEFLAIDIDPGDVWSFCFSDR